jgi:hypothetical protein
MGAVPTTPDHLWLERPLPLKAARQFTNVWRRKGIPWSEVPVGAALLLYAHQHIADRATATAQWCCRATARLAAPSSGSAQASPAPPARRTG